MNGWKQTWQKPKIYIFNTTYNNCHKITRIIFIDKKKINYKSTFQSYRITAFSIWLLLLLGLEYIYDIDTSFYCRIQASVLLAPSSVAGVASKHGMHKQDKYKLTKTLQRKKSSIQSASPLYSQPYPQANHPKHHQTKMAKLLCCHMIAFVYSRPPFQNACKWNLILATPVCWIRHPTGFHGSD